MKLSIRGAAILIVVTMVGLIGCSNAALYKGMFSDNSTAQVNFCTTLGTSVTTKVKYLFVMDQSQNNQQNYIWAGPTATPQPDPNGGTDPTGTVRYSQALINFLNNNNSTPNIYYAALFFNTDAIIPFNNYTGGGYPEDNLEQSIWYSNTGAGDTVNTATYISQQFQNIACPAGGYPCGGPPQADGGWSDYSDTLTQVLDAIQQDIGYEQTLVAEGGSLTPSSYVIFWVSSSYPYVAGGPQNTAALVGQVSAITALKAEQQYAPYIASIIFNTGFYSTNSFAWSQQVTQTTLEQMAAAGQGAFVNFATSSIDYSKFTVPQATQPFELRDFWIHDASAVWWNGQLMLDSDNDGIPDQIETQWGSNPMAYDSDQNGVGDGVEYNIWGSPCGSIPAGQLGQPGQTCTVAGAIESFRGVPNCGNPGTYPNIYPDTDLDYLNDCEEGLLGTNHLDFDSNQDWVPDQFEWLYNVPFLYGTNGLNADPMNDGVDNYQKLKDLFPINTPFSQIHGVVPLNYQLTLTSSNNLQSCYTANIQNIATMSSSDVLRVYVMESHGPVGTLRHMRVLKNVTHINGSIIINDGDLTP